MKLRLLIRGDCNRACPGCCNKQWKLQELPLCTDFTGYTEIMITGGEPMLDYRYVIQCVRAIRRQTDAPIYMYTAKTMPPHELGIVLHNIDGVTITLHKPSDLQPFLRFNAYMERWKLWKNRQLRVNVFKPIVLPTDVSLDRWVIKPSMEWIIDCPLPDDEVFMRLEQPVLLGNWTGKE